MSAAELPAMCRALRDDLGLSKDLKCMQLLNAACDLIGCDKQGTLVERAQRCLEAIDVDRGEARPVSPTPGSPSSGGGDGGGDDRRLGEEEGPGPQSAPPVAAPVGGDRPLAEDAAARAFGVGFYKSIAQQLERRRRGEGGGSGGVARDTKGRWRRRFGGRGRVMSERPMSALAFEAGVESFLSHGFRFGDPAGYLHPCVPQ